MGTFVAKNVVRLELKGADELSNAFLSIPQSMRRSVLTKAVTKASRVMVGPLRRATPKRSDKRLLGRSKNPPGTMRKATGLVVRKYRGGAIAAAYIGHRWPKGAAAHLVAKGTTDRQTKKGVRTGKVTGSNFFEPVVQAHKGQVAATMKSELAIGLEAAREKAAMKALKKAVNK